MGIPKSIQASTAAAHGGRYEGHLAVAQMQRLAAIVAKPTGELAVQWRASATGGYRALQGRIGGALQLRCKTCQKTYAWPVDLEIELRLVDTEAQEAEVLKDHEPYLVRDDQLPLREITEDELLLALPLMPRCETCENNAQSQPQPEIPDEPARPNPFAALKKDLNLKS